MKIEKFKFPNVIDAGMDSSDHWMMMEMLNRIIDGVNHIIDAMPKCSCPTPEERGRIHKDIVDNGEYGSSGMCDLHGRWEITHPDCG